jgi:dihydroflavonol-4-reductase
MNRVNVRGTETVLSTADRLGLDPIVHVSSEVALLPAADGEILTADSPVQRPAGTYSQTKADSELVARRLQARGAPVVSIMPAAIWGPHDPNFGEGVTLAANILRNRFPIIMSGGMHITDARDVAAATRRGDGAGPGTTGVHGCWALHLDAGHRAHARSPQRSTDPVRDRPLVVPCRIRSHG